MRRTAMSSDSRPTLSRTPAPPPSPAIARAPNAHASSPVLLVPPPPQDLLHAPVSRTPGSRARYFSQFTQIRCPARAFRL